MRRSRRRNGYGRGLGTPGLALWSFLLAFAGAGCSRKTDGGAATDTSTCESGTCAGASGQPGTAGTSNDASLSAEASSTGSSTGSAAGNAPSGGAPSTVTDGGTAHNGGASSGVGGTTSSGETEALDAIPPGCELLAERRDVECRNEACEQARSEPPRPRAYFLNVDRYVTDENGDLTDLPDAEVDRRAECQRTWLTDLGFEALGSSRNVSTVGTWQQLQVVLGSALLDSFNVGCWGTLCDDCFGLDEPQCNADAFCTATAGWPIDEDLECLGTEQFAYCSPFDGECGDAFTTASLDGACWEFPSVCYDIPGLTNDDPGCTSLSTGMQCDEP